MSTSSELLNMLSNDIDLNNNQNREYELLAIISGTDYVDTNVINGNTYCYQNT